MAAALRPSKGKVEGGHAEIRAEKTMIVGERLEAIREMKQMRQGDIEARTGLLRCYISRVENGNTLSRRPLISTILP